MDSRLKLGMLTYGLDRPPTGIGRYSIELITSLTYLNARPVLLGTPASYLPSVESYQRVAMPGTHFLPGLLTFGNFIVPRIVQRLGLDVIHDPTGNGPFYFGAAGSKIVLTIPDVFALAHPGTSTFIEKIVTRYWLPGILRRVDAVTTISDYSKRDIARFFNLSPEKIHVTLPAGGRNFMPLKREEVLPALSLYHLDAGYILMVGAISERRNLPRLLEAYSILVREGEKRHLVVIGKQHHGRDQRAELVEKFGLQGRVTFLGYMTATDLPTIYSAADLFVFPSLYEGFGIPPLEAMASGVPVACSDATSLPEVCGDAALLFDPYNVQDMANAMRRILADRDLAQDLRQRGIKRAAAFNWESTAKKTLAVYESLM